MITQKLESGEVVACSSYVIVEYHKLFHEDLVRQIGTTYTDKNDDSVDMTEQFITATKLAYTMLELGNPDQVGSYTDFMSNRSLDELSNLSTECMTVFANGMGVSNDNIAPSGKPKKKR